MIKAAHISRIFILGMTALSVWCWFVGTAHALSDHPNVLVVHSTHQGDPWADNVASGIAEVMRDKLPGAELYVEYLDTRRHLPEQVFADLRQLFFVKYEHASVDLIIVSGDTALAFVLEFRESLFAGVPVVFCGLDSDVVSRFGALDSVTGVVRGVDIKGSVDLVLKLLPSTRHIVSVNDSSPSGRENVQRLRRIKSLYAGRVDFIELDNMTVTELANSLQTLPNDSAVLYMEYFRDRDGRSFGLRESLDLVIHNTQAPLFVLWDWYIGDGVLGGLVVSGVRQGQAAARMGLEILQGRPVSTVSIRTASPNVTMFNYDQLVKFGVPLNILPEGSQVINLRESFFSKYEREVWIAAAVAGTLLLLLVVAIVIGTRRRKERDRFQRIVDSSPAPLLVVGVNGRILRSNPQAQALLGYSFGELRELSAASLVVSDGGRDPFEELRIGGAESGRIQALRPIRRKGGELLNCRLLGVIMGPGQEAVWSLIDVSKQVAKVADLEQLVQKWKDQAAMLDAQCMRAKDSGEEDRGKRQLAERALLANEQAYFSGLEGLFRDWPCGVAAVGSDMRLLWANPVFLELAGSGISGAVGHPLDGALDQSWQACVQGLAQALESGAFEGEHQLRLDTGGGGRTLAWATAPFRDLAGGVGGAVLIVRDVSRTVDLETRLLERDRFRTMVGESKPMEHLFAVLENMVDFDSPAIIVGEPGTGKGLVAEALHDTGPNRAGPLVRVDCSALSGEQLESELFGHVRGAFNGAFRDKAGRFVAADGGTLYLDEMGDISLTVQEKLLNYLDRGEILPVGADTSVPVRVRVLGSTSADLGEKVRDGVFREDLFYRFKPMTVFLPPLRERGADVRLLTDHFVSVFCGRLAKKIDAVDDRAMSVLLHHSWPGNVRELKRAVEHACIVCDGPVIRLKHFPPEFMARASGEMAPVLVAQSPKLDKKRVVDVLNEVKWNKTKAADVLGISRRHLYRKLEQYDLK